MSRKTDRLAKKANKKNNAPTVEKIEAAEESSDEEIPEAVAIEDHEEEEQEDSEAEEEEAISGDDDNEPVEKEVRPIRAKINDEAAMIRITEAFKLKNLPWIETMTITSSEPVVVEDVQNDMQRELAFYQQALEAAKLGRELVKKAGAEFSRPEDYFAEMLKSDEHMAKIRQKLLDESASLKASEDAKRQRQLKKFGKKVQVEKQLERQKQKSEMLDKIKLLKRKRKDGEDLTLNDDFDIALEKADTKRAKTDKKSAPAKSQKRVNKDLKYGSGGKKGRFAKSNTLESTSGLGGYNKMKGKPIFKGKGKASPKKK
ncbi:rRNA processing protein Ebp2 [Mucor ambiguus]|uniref:rRNA processing protein Ebp2 n=1 Tax=Mucor ambiguus TaxID=91626 RepID=A0A0C9MDU3_9FUNG|nr:rRNA processing protein Ebp2 [Mucor ambiguus]